MTTQGLAQSEKRLLERHHDGALVGKEREQAERLLAQVSLARDYASSLKELGTATRAAEQELWERAEVCAVEEVAMAAIEGAGVDVSALELTALESMLLRFHDDEVTAEEAAEVEHLMSAREDVASYLGGLGELELGVKSATAEAVDAVDFSGFWGRLEDAMDASEELTGEPEQDEGAQVLSFPGATRERPSFNNDDHQVLLYRFFDGEASDEERRQVKAWQEIDPNVASTLGALTELNLAVRASMELAEEHIEPGLLWSMIEDGLGDAQLDNVASLSAHREAREANRSATPNHRREIFIALAAVLCTVMGVALFGDGLLKGDPVIVEKTVVIVDSLEYGDGTSVMVTGPMQTASMEVDGEEPSGESEEGVEEETPTVIWLIDPNADVSGEESVEESDDVKLEEHDAGRHGKPI